MNCGSVNPTGYKRKRAISSVNILNSKYGITVWRLCETDCALRRKHQNSMYTIFIW